MFLAKKKKPHYTNHEVIPMKVRAVAWDGDSLRGFRFYRQAQTLSEYAQLALLAAVIVPPCVEEWTR